MFKVLKLVTEGITSIKFENKTFKWKKIASNAKSI